MLPGRLETRRRRSDGSAIAKVPKLPELPRMKCSASLQAALDNFGDCGNFCIFGNSKDFPTCPII